MLRENPADRETLFNAYKEQLEELDFHYEIISGSTPEERLEKALQLVEAFPS